MNIGKHITFKGIQKIGSQVSELIGTNCGEKGRWVGVKPNT
jgi:hypothetical protein